MLDSPENSVPRPPAPLTAARRTATSDMPPTMMGGTVAAGLELDLLLAEASRLTRDQRRERLQRRVGQPAAFARGHSRRAARRPGHHRWLTGLDQWGNASALFD